MKKFLKEINDLVCEAVTEARCEGSNVAYITYNCNDGYIDISIDHNDTVEVAVCPYEDKGHEFPNIEKAIADTVTLWYDVEIDFDYGDPYSDWAKYYGRI